MPIDFNQSPDFQKASQMAQTLGFMSVLDAFNCGTLANIELIRSMTAGTTSIAHFCLDQIETYKKSFADAVAETAKVLHLEIKIVRDVFRDDVRIWQHTRSENFINQVIPLSEKQFNYCLQILPPVNHPTMLIQHISESIGEGRYLYFWKTAGFVNSPYKQKFFACQTTPEEIEAIIDEHIKRKCFHSICENKATEKLEISNGVLDLCADCATRYADAEGFGKLWAIAQTEQTEESFNNLDKFYQGINF